MTHRVDHVVDPVLLEIRPHPFKSLCISLEECDHKSSPIDFSEIWSASCQNHPAACRLNNQTLLKPRSSSVFTQSNNASDLSFSSSFNVESRQLRFADLIHDRSESLVDD